MTQRIDPDDNLISVVEEIDAEPERAVGRGWWSSSRSRELVLGLLLLCGVLAWVGFTWWRAEINTRLYAQGLDEAAHRNWDEALANYSDAQGYRDADALAAHALKQVEERNSLYQEAVSLQESGPAVRVLLAARAVQEIQPAYGDVDSIAARAEDQVYTDALSGTVVMRTEAQPPGLYYRGTGGWSYLLGSDQWSSVLSIPFSAATDRYVVYDVPGPDWIAPGPLIRSPFGPYGYSISQGSPEKIGRQLVRVELPGGANVPTFHDLKLDPVNYNFYICGGAGVWGIRYDPGAFAKVMVRGRFDGFTPTYEKIPAQADDPGAGTVTRVVMPAADAVVADFGHEGNRENKEDTILLATRRADAGDKASTSLYLANADGSDSRAIFSTAGTLISARLSPDDRYALVVVSEQIESPAGNALMSAVLVTLDGSRSDKVLQKIPTSTETGSGYPGFSPGMVDRLIVSGVFLESGIFKNKLLLAWSHEHDAAAVSTRLRLVDVSNPDSILAETDMPYDNRGVLTVVEQPGGQAVLLYNQGVAATSKSTMPGSAYLVMLQAEDGTDNFKVGNFSVPVPLSGASGGSTPYFMNPTLRGTYLIYSVETFTTMPESSSSYSLSLDSLGTMEGGASTSSQDALQLFHRSWPARRSIGDTGPEWGFAGPGAYAYTDEDGALHAHLYDAKVDVILERGTGNIVALNANYFYKVLY